MYNDLLLNRIVPPVDNSDEEIQDLITEIEELDSLLSPEAQELIEDLRPYIVTDDVYEEIDEQATFGQRLSDRLASFAGSWTFILSFGGLMIIWIVLNATMGAGGKADDHSDLTAAETPETTKHLSDASLGPDDKDATAEAIERATAVNGKDKG